MVRCKNIWWCLALVLIVNVLLIGLYYSETLRGLWQLKFGAWIADAYIQQDAEKLKSDFAAAGIELMYGRTSGHFGFPGTLLGNQYILRYQNGEPYIWFHWGVAINLGYIVVENRGDKEIVVEVRRQEEVDGP